MSQVTAGRLATPQISGHQNALDGVRAVAALAVLVFHIGLNAGLIARQVTGGWVVNGGQSGVAIFFVLSGLLLYRPWAHAALGGRSAPGAGGYLLRRALRILPAYWALVVVVLLTAHRDHLGDPWTWLGTLTLTHIYAPQDWWNSALGPREMGQAWSLAVEAAWYVALPPTAALLARSARGGADLADRARRLLRALGWYAAISFVFTIAMHVPDYHPAMGIWPPRYTAWFAAGMALAVLTVWAKEDPHGAGARFCRTVTGSWGACWLAALSLLVISASPVTGPLDLNTAPTLWTSLLHIVVYGLCAVFFVAPVALAPAGHPVLETVLGNPFMCWLGRISYGVFLWQMVIVLAWYDLTGRLFHGNLLTDLPLLAGVTVLAGAVSYYVIEHPVQLLYRRGRPAPGRPVPGPS